MDRKLLVEVERRRDGRSANNFCHGGIDMNGSQVACVCVSASVSVLNLCASWSLVSPASNPNAAAKRVKKKEIRFYFLNLSPHDIGTYAQQAQTFVSRLARRRPPLHHHSRTNSQFLGLIWRPWASTQHNQVSGWIHGAILRNEAEGHLKGLF